MSVGSFRLHKMINVYTEASVFTLKPKMIDIHTLGMSFYLELKLFFN